jgi:flagellar biosynthetic protein FliR
MGMHGPEIVVPPERVIHFVLVLARLGGLMIAAPIFAHHGVPARVRVAVTVATAVGLAGLVPVGGAGEIVDVPNLAGATVLELALGLMVGLTAELVLAGAVMGGELAGVQMGLGIAQVVDPRTQLQMTPIALWVQFVGLQVFLAVDGHHLLVQALLRSFDLAPPGSLGLSGRELGALLASIGTMFEMAVRIAAPVLGGLLITDAALGLLARAVPQLNVFFMGFALKIGVGFLLLGAGVPYAVTLIGGRLGRADGLLGALLGGLH